MDIGMLCVLAVVTGDRIATDCIVLTVTADMSVNDQTTACID